MDEITEKLQLKKQEREVDRYYKQYRDQMKIIESSNSLIKKVRTVNENDIWALGKQLENFEIYKQLHEDDGTLSSLGRIPTIAFDDLNNVA